MIEPAERPIATSPCRTIPPHRRRLEEPPHVYTREQVARIASCISAGDELSLSHRLECTALSRVDSYRLVFASARVRACGAVPHQRGVLNLHKYPLTCDFIESISLTIAETTRFDKSRCCAIGRRGSRSALCAAHLDHNPLLVKGLQCHCDGVLLSGATDSASDPCDTPTRHSRWQSDQPVLRQNLAGTRHRPLQLKEDLRAPNRPFLPPQLDRRP